MDNKKEMIDEEEVMDGEGIQSNLSKFGFLAILVLAAVVFYTVCVPR